MPLGYFAFEMGRTLLEGYCKSEKRCIRCWRKAIKTPADNRKSTVLSYSINSNYNIIYTVNSLH